jgi:hypothetical protein
MPRECPPSTQPSEAARIALAIFSAQTTSLKRQHGGLRFCMKLPCLPSRCYFPSLTATACLHDTLPVSTSKSGSHLRCIVDSPQFSVHSWPFQFQHIARTCLAWPSQAANQANASVSQCGGWASFLSQAGQPVAWYLPYLSYSVQVIR